MSYSRMIDYLQEGKLKTKIDINKNFLLAVRDMNYLKCNYWLEAGANINIKFGQYSPDYIDICADGGPNAWPLTYAVKKENMNLVELFLQYGAKTEIFYCGQTPLMIAATKRNIQIVELLITAGADPNIKNEACSFLYPNTDLTAMHQLFLSLNECFLEAQIPAVKIIASLLIKANFMGEHDDILNTLKKYECPHAICSLFSKIWRYCFIENKSDFARENSIYLKDHREFLLSNSHLPFINNFPVIPEEEKELLTKLSFRHKL